MGIQEREEKGIECLVKAAMADSFPSPGIEMDIQIPEAQKTSNRLNLNRAIVRYIKIVKIQTQGKNFKSRTRKERSYMQGNSQKTISEFSTKTFQAKRELDDIFKVLKESNCQPKILYQNLLDIVKAVHNDKCLH